jgi:hypothetical protein
MDYLPGLFFCGNPQTMLVCGSADVKGTEPADLKLWLDPVEQDSKVVNNDSGKDDAV